nr:lysosomal thioesterase PPT2 isoform X2 [Microcebus murinus]
MKSCKTPTWGGRGLNGTPGLASALQTTLPLLQRRQNAGDYLSPVHPHPPLGRENCTFRCGARPCIGKWGNQGGNQAPASLGAVGSGGAFFGLPDMFPAFSSPHQPKWIAPPISSPLLGRNGMFHPPSGPSPALRGTLARLPGKAPDVTAVRDPEQPAPHVRHSRARSPLKPFPSPVGSRLERSKQRAERGLQTQARREHAGAPGAAAPLGVGPAPAAFPAAAAACSPLAPPHALQAGHRGARALRQLVQLPPPAGIHQRGGLVCRALLSVMDDHNVDSFISLSSPQMGQYGDTDYLKWLFPTSMRSNLYRICYSPWGQEFSICNYWHAWRKNFLRVGHLVLIGGPDDGVITPWQSSFFGFYDANETVLEMEEQLVYLRDSFGLKTLLARGAIVRCPMPGIPHTAWHSNRTLYETCIEPWLS